MTVVEVLKAARDKVERGWCQGTGSRQNSAGHDIAWCAVTAVHVDIPDGNCAPICGLVAKAIGKDIYEIAYWNDTPGRTKAEVLAAFDRAIALAEAAP